MPYIWVHGGFCFFFLFYLDINILETEITFKYNSDKTITLPSGITRAPWILPKCAYDNDYCSVCRLGQILWFYLCKTSIDFFSSFFSALMLYAK